LAELVPLAALVEEFAAQQQLSQRLANTLDLLLAELFTNIVDHAYGGGSHTIHLQLNADERQVIAVLTDSGKPFNPLEALPYDPRRPLEDRDIGGIGLHLVRQFSQSLSYARDGGRNTLTLTLARD